MQEYPQNTQSLEVALSAMPVGVSWANLADQKIVFMNRKFTEIFGYELADFADISDWVEKTYLFAEDRDLVARTWGASLASSHHSELAIAPIEIRILCKNGEVKTVISSGVILPETGWALATFVDITDRKRDELLLREAERQAAENQVIYRLLLDHSPEMIVLSPFDESRRYVSSAVQQITGFTAEEFLALDKYDSVHPEDREETKRIIQDLRVGNLRQVFRYRILCKGGSYRWVEAIVIGYIDRVSGRLGGYVATIRDIAAQKQQEDRFAADYLQMSEVASLDELTGIANRRAFNYAIQAEARRHTRSDCELSLLMVDVDHFKRYNDLYGHLAGDECLRKIAATLRNTVGRDADFPARFGGEEFAILMPMTDSAGGERVAGKILEAISALGVTHAGSPNGVVTVSVGIATWPAGEALYPNVLIEQADRALYQAKDRGRNLYVVG